MSAVAAPNDAGRSTSSTDTAKAPQLPAAVDAFEGDWYYGADCDFGHYVTLGLKRAGRGYTGDWSDGTRVRGPQCNLQADVRNGELVAQLCDDATDVGGPPDCPNFEEAHDVFVRSGDSLAWSHVYDGKRTPYVALHRTAQAVDRRADCKDQGDTDNND